jgi:Family of unknown function (DUF6461)
METSGLRWLATYEWPLCLVFVRGVAEDEVFRSLGADPADAVVRTPMEVAQAVPGPVVQVGRTGEWVVVVEETEPPQGIRPEVLRRLSDGGEAVALHKDIGKGNHQFGYAADGDIIAALTTTIPLHWSGSDPARFEPLARQLGLTEDAEEPDDIDEWEAVVALAERAFGLRLAQADLDQPMRSAQVLPPLADLTPHPAVEQVFRIGNDPVLDLLLNRADPATLAAVAAVRIRRLMAAVGLDSYPELAAAAEAAIAGEAGHPADDDAAGTILRRIARDQDEAEDYLANIVNGVRLPVPEAELQQRVRRGDAAKLLRLLLDKRPSAQLLVCEIVDQQIWDAKGWQEPLSWRPQAIADLRHVEVPPAELQAAEQAWLAEPEPVRGRWGMIDAGPVRAHVHALIASGMDPGRVAELSGENDVFIDGLLRGYFDYVDVDEARQLLLIRA